MLTIADLAKASDVSAHTVRYYVKEGLLIPAAQADNNYRLFTQQDVTRLRFIRMAKMLGFTLSEIRQILEHAKVGESPCADVREIIRKHILENRRKIRELQALQTRMEQALEKWQDMPDKTPDGNSICHLIESMSDTTGDNT
ncbi:MAG: MerR family transcriptional regulator [Thiolinea sp.]